MSWTSQRLNCGRPLQTKRASDQGIYFCTARREVSLRQASAFGGNTRQSEQPLAPYELHWMYSCSHCEPKLRWQSWLRIPSLHIAMSQYKPNDRTSLLPQLGTSYLPLTQSNVKYENDMVSPRHYSLSLLPIATAWLAAAKSLKLGQNDLAPATELTHIKMWTPGIWVGSQSVILYTFFIASVAFSQS